MSSGNVRELFEAALLLSPESRSDWLARQAIDAEVAARVAALLQAELLENSVLDRPFSTQLRSLAVPSMSMDANGIGTQVEGYRLLRLLGQGGMARVFAAERVDADFTQQVAIKLLRRTLHSEWELRFFQRERQALSSLEHPNIARLLDGGVTATGVPYLVMELVDGTDLLTFAQQHALSLRARLSLFAQVCDAVNAAHRALIVHRDIKPANVLVNRQGIVKLLDFGIAKILCEEPTDAVTTYAPLTPEYAAPEQFEGGVITTASDVYGLGVVLHELLLGIRPLRANRNPADGVRASDLITADSAGAPTTAPVSRAELKRFLRGDIDNILRQALSSLPIDRYASAGDLAAELRRFLDGLPVQAHPPSARYRFTKFIRRHRVAVALFTALLFGLTGSVAVAFGQAQQAQRMSEEAQRRTLQAQAQTLATQLALRESDAVQRFLFDIIRAVNPNDALDSPDTLREILDQAQHRVATELAAQPAVQVEIYGFLRQIREQFGDNPQAIALGEMQLELAQKYLGERHQKTAAAQFQLARLLLFRGDEGAFTMLQSAVETLGAVAPNSLDHSYALVAFASAQSQSGRTDDALLSLHSAGQFLAQLCAAGEKNACREQVTALSHLGIAYYQKRDYHAAVRAFTEGAERAEKTYGAVHSMTLRLLGNLATCQVQIDPNYAITTLKRVMHLTKQLPTVALDTVPAQHNGLGLALSRVGDSEGARAQFETALRQIDPSQRSGPQQKIFSLNLISELILLGDEETARNQLRSVRALLKPTEENYIHLARAAEFSAWLDTLAGSPAERSYQQIESALDWRKREANPRISDMLRTLALGVRIAARFRDVAQARTYLRQAETLSQNSAVLSDTVVQELQQARFELAAATGDSAAAQLALVAYEKVVGDFRPNAALQQLKRMQTAQIMLSSE